MAWNDDLKEPHLTVAAYTGSPLRVVAGPGTGKTFALMRRIARLLESGVAPDKILTVTFTRTAASDLLNKLAELAVPGARNVKACTLHSFAFALLTKAEVFALTNRVARPLLDHEVDMLIADLAKVAGGKREARRLLRAFEAYWATRQTDDPGPPQEQAAQEFDVALRQWLEFHRGMLLNEVVPVALQFIRDNPHSPHVPAFAHVLVDEYQDLNRADQALIDELARAGSVAVVGDPDQSIYRFRFANPDALAHLHPGTHDVVLAECRRCPQRVVAMATSLVAHNPGRSLSALTPAIGKAPGDVSIVQQESLQAEVESIAAYIDWYLLKNPNVPAGEVLVLTNRRRIGYLIRDALNDLAAKKIRYWGARSFFFEEALDHDAAQEGFTLLALLADPDDRVALRTWIGLGSSSARVGGWARIRDYCAQTGRGLRETLDALKSGELDLPHCRLGRPGAC